MRNAVRNTTLDLLNAVYIEPQHFGKLCVQLGIGPKGVERAIRELRQVGIIIDDKWDHLFIHDASKDRAFEIVSSYWEAQLA